MEDRECSVDDCVRHVRALGWCDAHYRRWRAHGDVQASIPLRKMGKSLICSTLDCVRPVQARGWCVLHYKRWQNYGDVQANIPPKRRDAATKIMSLCIVEGCDIPARARNMCQSHYSKWHRDNSTLINGPCAVDSCVAVARTGGYCDGHYHRSRNGGLRLEEPIQHGRSECRVGQCNRIATSLGLCQAHYTRFKKFGDVQIDIPIRKVRLQGERRVEVSGYAYIGARTEHQIVMEQILGRPLKPNENVHHKNTIRDDNDPSNLELWNISQPSGGRVRDKVTWAIDFVNQYMPEALAGDAENLVRQAEEKYL